LARTQGRVRPAGVADRPRLLTDYPTPQAAARLGQARMASFCRRHSYRGGKPPAALLARLRSAPTAPVGIPPATLATLAGAQVQLLRTLLVTIAELESRIAKRVACHPRAKLLASLPGIGTINLAQLLAEVGPILERVPSAEHAAAECGAAPVTKASGKTSGVRNRLARRPSRSLPRSCSVMIRPSSSGQQPERMLSDPNPVLYRKSDADHGRVRAVSSTKRRLMGSGFQVILEPNRAVAPLPG
jgi:hypothetical protein